MVQRGSLKLLCGLALIASCALGQWLHYPTPGIPRLPDGKPNLTAPARRRQPMASRSFGRVDDQQKAIQRIHRERPKARRRPAVGRGSNQSTPGELG